MLTIDADLDLIEALAKREHEKWADYMRYFLGKCQYDYWHDTFTFPRKYYQALMVLVDTPYEELSDEQKELDREEAVKTYKVISEHVEVSNY